MQPGKSVGFYFDFVSPYSWLALAAAPAFAKEHGVAWQLEPIVYGVLLDRHGLIGPVETEAKRRYTMRDVARCADLAGRRFVGPPQHPFRSLAALRTLELFHGEPRALDLAVALADAAWSGGRDLADVSVLAQVVTGQGFDAVNLDERIRVPEVKEALRERTEGAIAAGVFGVPTFRWGDELFWGQDRMGHLAARLREELGPPDSRTTSMLARPIGVKRAASSGPRP